MTVLLSLLCAGEAGAQLDDCRRAGPRCDSLRIAIGIGRGVAALQPDLMRPLVAKIEEEVGVEAHPALGVGIELDHPALDAVGIELSIPGQVEGVGDIDAAPIPA